MALKLTDLMVLLVEPSATQQKIICNYLNNLGIHQIYTVLSGQEALIQMEDYEPDLVISTLYLPDMTGTDLVHKMRENERFNDTAFMLASSETRFRYLDPIRQAGAIAILPKPFSQDALRIALGSTLEFLDPDSLDLGRYDPENLNVLIVDDSALARKYIKKTLKNLGLEIFTEANNGKEAMELLDQNFFDLIVTDYNMPEMDGEALVNHIRANSNQSSIPIIMVTSEENENRLAAVQQAGVSAICDKPFEPGNIRTLLQQLFTDE
ncbi:response regulator [Sedimenticola selenatireducens]|uniref:Response regulator n=1 Tax=Sedimenticola selenatireducens TaxID=191960 RepID=A0A557RSR0_9GAMM|nr:response regulator [Sedimenticola selenatireducens]TVO68175.1 response regulator [Sedimenticola selenatireducens]TVT66173.1 MAG: response regulator [Sedimenticola selenatireducens]